MLRRLLPWLPVVAVVLAAVVLAGQGGEDVPAARPRVPRSSPLAVATSLSSAAALSMVHDAVLTRADLPSRFGPDGVLRGTALGGPASLRLCGASFDTERFRLARNRVSFASSDGRTRVVDEVVAYEHGYAARALLELAAIAPRCSRPVPAAPVQQPGVLALRVLLRDPSGPPGARARQELLVERRGDVLSVLRVQGPRGPLALDVARTLGRRLVRLQPTPLG